MEWYLGVLRKYTDFEGRARRQEYWMFVLINTVIGWGLGMIDDMLGTYSSTGYGVLAAFYGLAVLIPSLAVMVRRLHDAGKSGWFFFINLIPIIGWIWFFVVLVTDSVPGSNRYGPNPKESGAGAPVGRSVPGSGQISVPNPAAAPLPSPPEGELLPPDWPDQIRKLAELRDAGLLSEEEFSTKKQKLLDKI